MRGRHHGRRGRDAPLDALGAHFESERASPLAGGVTTVLMTRNARGHVAELVTTGDRFELADARAP